MSKKVDLVTSVDSNVYNSLFVSLRRTMYNDIKSKGYFKSTVNFFIRSSVAALHNTLNFHINNAVSDFMKKELVINKIVKKKLIFNVLGLVNEAVHTPLNIFFRNIISVEMRRYAVVYLCMPIRRVLLNNACKFVSDFLCKKNE